MSILSDTVRGVGRLLFPVRCPVCGGKMPPGSRVVAPLPLCRAAYGFLLRDLQSLVGAALGAGSRRTGFGLPLLHPRQRVARTDPPLQIRRRMAPCTRYGRMVRSLPGRQRPLRHGGPDRPRPAPLAQTVAPRLQSGGVPGRGIARALRAEVDRHSVRRSATTPRRRSTATPSGGTTSRESSPYAVPKGSRGTISCWWTTCSLRAPHCSHAPRRSCAPRPTAG